MSKIKKIILSSFVFLFVVGQMLLYPVAARAEDVWYDQDFPGWYSRVYDNGNASELFGERYTAAQVQWIFYSLIGIFMNFVGDLTGNREHFRECAVAVLGGQVTNIFDAGECAAYLIDILLLINPIVDNSVNESSGLASGFTLRPISSTSYFVDVANRLHFIPEAQAQQGFGFTAGNMILPLWRGARDVSYFILVVVLIIMAFMIMFRMKISPQTVITIQSAIPKVVITLLLVTFSYAIAGLMIDLMYVAIGLLNTVIRNAGIIDTTASPDWSATFQELTSNNSVFKLMTAYWVLVILASFSAFMTTAGTLYIGGAFIGLGMLVVMTIVCIYLLVKVSFMLVKNFVLLLFKIVFGPLQIVVGTISGNGFSGWLRDMAALLAVYPVTGLLFVFSFLFLRGAFVAGGGTTDANLFPFDVSEMLNTQTSWSPPLTGSEDFDIIWLFASIAVMMMVPKVPDMIKSAMSGRPFDYGSAIGEGFAPAMGPGKGAVGYSLSKTKAGYLPIPIQRATPAAYNNWLTTSSRGKWVASNAGKIAKYGSEKRWW